MTKRRASKKLQLNRTSLRKLRTEDLAPVAGGVVKEETATCACKPPDDGGSTQDGSVISTLTRTANHNQNVRR